MNSFILQVYRPNVKMICEILFDFLFHMHSILNGMKMVPVKNQCVVMKYNTYKL